jgi:hypothetical protein
MRQGIGVPVMNIAVLALNSYDRISIVFIDVYQTWELTLQKSMLFTPLLPNAGPTGGDGEAWPAPTMSLTITSFASAFLDIVADAVSVFDCCGR